MHQGAQLGLLCDTVDEFLVFLTVIVGAFGKFLVHAVDGGVHLVQVFKRPGSFFFHGQLILELHLLGQVTDGDVRLACDSATGGLLLTSDDSKHSGFAGSVFADKGNLVPLVNNKTDVLKQYLTAKFHLETLYRNHARIVILAAKLQKNLDTLGTLDNLVFLKQAQRLCLGRGARSLDVVAVNVYADAAQVHFIGDFARRSRAAVGIQHDAVMRTCGDQGQAV